MKRLILFAVLIMGVFLIIACSPKEEFSPEEKEIFGEGEVVGLAAGEKGCKQTTVLSCIEGRGSSITMTKFVNGKLTTYTLGKKCLLYVPPFRGEQQPPKVYDFHCVGLTVLELCKRSCAPGQGCVQGSCVSPCGNGLIEGDETCSSCPSDVMCNVGEVCQSDTCISLCGNGVVDSEENCATCPEDSPCLGGIICNPSGTCVIPLVCGNGIVESNEVCDDGNIIDNDLCSADCTVSYQPLTAPQE